MGAPHLPVFCWFHKNGCCDCGPCRDSLCVGWERLRSENARGNVSAVQSDDCVFTRWGKEAGVLGKRMKPSFNAVHFCLNITADFGEIWVPDTRRCASGNSNRSTDPILLFRVGEAKLGVGNCRGYRGVLCTCNISKIQRRREKLCSRRRCILISTVC